MRVCVCSSMCVCVTEICAEIFTILHANFFFYQTQVMSHCILLNICTGNYAFIYTKKCLYVCVRLFVHINMCLCVRKSISRVVISLMPFFLETGVCSVVVYTVNRCVNLMSLREANLPGPMTCDAHLFIHFQPASFRVLRLQRLTSILLTLDKCQATDAVCVRGGGHLNFILFSFFFSYPYVEHFLNFALFLHAVCLSLLVLSLCGA